MFRFIDRLTVELEDKRRMAGFQNVVVDVLMTCHAGVRAHVKIPQVVHAGAHAHGVCPIAPRVSAQPRTGRPVTSFAGNAFVGMRAGSESRLGDRVKWRMANGATRVRGRFAAADTFGDAGRSRIGQNGEGLGVKILGRPGDVLAALLASAAMTTGGSTTNGANKLRAVLPCLFSFSGDRRGYRNKENATDSNSERA